VLEEEPAEPPSLEHKHVFESQLTPGGGRRMGPQFIPFPQPVASTATAETAQSHRNPLTPLLKAFMRSLEALMHSRLAHHSAWGSLLK
jgi:hypothetical protein